MTKDEFEKNYFVEIGVDSCGPTAAYRIRTEKIIENSDTDEYTKELLLRLNDEMCKTFQVLENAINNLCD